MVEDRFGRRPYGWPEWEVVLLVARLVGKGEISLVDGWRGPSTDKVYEAVIAPSKWRRITVIKRQTVPRGSSKPRATWPRTSSAKSPPTARTRWTRSCVSIWADWRSDLAQYKTLTDTGDYPGSQEIADALGVIAKLLAERESFGLIGKFLERKGDLLDLSDSVRELESFYETQRPTWEKLRKANGRFQLNRTWLDKDATAAAALQRMRDILGAAAPYGMIKDAESLIQAVEGVDAALVTQHREQVLQDIDAQIGKVQVELDDAQAPAELRSHCLHPLQSLKRQVESQASLAHIDQARQGAIEAADDAFEKIEAAAKQKERLAKPRRVVKAAELAPKGFLETQEDVDGYLERLRQELEAAIRAGERVEIR